MHTPMPPNPATAPAVAAAAVRVLSVNVGAAAPLDLGNGRRALSGIRKRPVSGPVAVAPLGLAADEQADLSVHGGLHKAVYAYPGEHLSIWQQARAAAGLGNGPLPPGFMGENLTLAGLLENQVWVGDELHADGSACVLRVTAPRQPCAKLNAVMGLRDAAQRMVRQRLCGFYLAVDVPGCLHAGQTLRLHPGPRRLSISEAIAAQWARHRNG